MTGNEYQRLAARTINTALTAAETEAHALYGMAAEVGELQGIYQKVFQGHPFDEGHVKKELGDIIWMVAEYCTASGWDLGDIMQLNIDKLRVRYPAGFDADHSKHITDN
ncbi:MAG: nucleoside triphosphate pyrophosphohydrolase family protein [bacterium]|nr:nucleoside triphosphate pyrophosphohydrolase family protein [bacterium]